MEYLFINPSPNLKLIAKALQISGQMVDCCYTADYQDFVPDDFRIFVGTRYIEEYYPGAQASSWALNLKKPFFGFENKEVQEILSALDPLLSSGSAQDSALFGGNFWREPKLPVTKSELSFNELVAAHPHATVFTASLPASGGKLYRSRWQTDFDAEKALGRDYFLFFDGKQRHELFYTDNELSVISPSKTLDWLTKLNPALKKFSFTQNYLQKFNRNTKTWLTRHSSRIYLLNDYSWQGISAKLPNDWAERIIEMVTDK